MKPFQCNTGLDWDGVSGHHGAAPTQSRPAGSLTALPPVQGWVVVLITQVISVGEVITLSKVLVLLFVLFLLGLNCWLCISPRDGAAGQ